MQTAFFTFDIRWPFNESPFLVWKSETIQRRQEAHLFGNIRITISKNDIGSVQETIDPQRKKYVKFVLITRQSQNVLHQKSQLHSDDHEQNLVEKFPLNTIVCGTHTLDGECCSDWNRKSECSVSQKFPRIQLRMKCENGSGKWCAGDYHRRQFHLMSHVACAHFFFSVVRDHMCFVCCTEHRKSNEKETHADRRKFSSCTTSIQSVVSSFVHTFDLFRLFRASSTATTN